MKYEGSPFGGRLNGTAVSRRPEKPLLPEHIANLAEFRLAIDHHATSDA
ncbi:hypothetical protein SAMN05443244_2354 [Terriglobus roseus]|uniref:Uncharacterized protein n=1 Tax=Terriglobus roseus TaxID=392734 RepID=A0A1H4NTX2_9BACT|nr:hypothetical protein SAMN05443244_2354 [Terriglobus roseus]